MNMNDKNIYIETVRNNENDSNNRAAITYLMQRVNVLEKKVQSQPSDDDIYEPVKESSLKEKSITPLWLRYTLTIREAADYFHIGEKRMRRIVEANPYANYIVMNGNRAMIKRKVFEQYIDEAKII